MKTMQLDSLKKLYFLGIGGIGMSAIARYFNDRGCEIYGYDRTETTLTKKLVAEGMKIHYEENTELIPPGIDLVVWTPAVPVEHAEWQFFKKAGTPMMKRAEVLGLISRNHRTIAVAGTHGKTTTSSMVAHLLHSGGISCMAFLGGICENFGSNYVAGNSDWVVVEADEYDRSFLHLSPDIAILLSADPDHLDIYGDPEQVMKSGFAAFLGKVKPGGKILMKAELTGHFESIQCQTFGLEKGDFSARNVRVNDGHFVFDFAAPASFVSGEATPASGRSAKRSRSCDETLWENMALPMPGRHNVENAAAALAVACQLGIGEEALRKGLVTFKGIKRRFEMIYRDEHCVYFDDYAHHPTELRSAIGAAKELLPGRKVTGIFQPHLYSRTRDFADGFAEALDQLDEVILLDIYPAREKPIAGVSSAIIFDRMQNPNKVLIRKEEALGELAKREVDVLLTLGAGDIDTLVEPIKELLKQRKESAGAKRSK